MRWLTMFALIVALGGLAGCTGVDSREPVGTAPAVLAPEEWNGTWMIPQQGSLFINVLDGDEGLVQIAVVEKKDEKLVLKSFDAQIRESGSWSFVSLKAEPEDTTYFWMRIRNENGQITLWLPSAGKFAPLVKEGVLPGEVADKGKVTLGKLTDEHLRIITSCEKGVLMEWEHPLILYRMKEGN